MLPDRLEEADRVQLLMLSAFNVPTLDVHVSDGLDPGYKFIFSPLFLPIPK